MFLFYLPALEISILLIQHGDLKADKETLSVGLPMFPSTGYELKKLILITSSRINLSKRLVCYPSTFWT